MNLRLHNGKQTHYLPITSTLPTPPPLIPPSLYLSISNPFKSLACFRQSRSETKRKLFISFITAVSLSPLHYPPVIAIIATSQIYQRQSNTADKRSNPFDYHSDNAARTTKRALPSNRNPELDQIQTCDSWIHSSRHLQNFI